MRNPPQAFPAVLIVLLLAACPGQPSHARHPLRLHALQRFFLRRGRFQQASHLVNHLSREEMKAVLDAPDPSTRTGVRDQAMLYLGFAAGLCVSELVGLRLDDLELDGTYPSILIHQ